MTIEGLIRAVQTELGVTVDGHAGPETWGAIYRAIVPVPLIPPEADISPVDPRSETNIKTLHPRVQPLARALVHEAALQGITIKVTSGTRSYAEQDALYEQGRSKPGRIVTNARAGFSNHNFGLAFDVTIFDGPNPVWESPGYKAVGAIGTALGLSWGGNWQSMVDEPHFELRPAWAQDKSESAMLAGLREREQAGVDQFA